MHQKSATTAPCAFARRNERDCDFAATLELRQEFTRLRYALTEVRCEHALRQLARATGRVPPPTRQWPRARNGVLEIPSLRSLKSSVAALRFQLALWRAVLGERKGGYDPNQPRVPRGEPGGGQWTDGGGNGGGSEPTDARRVTVLRCGSLFTRAPGTRTAIVAKAIRGREDRRQVPRPRSLNKNQTPREP
jgi:hypothetical protein